MGRESTKPAADVGERMLRAPATSAGKDKFDVRWKEGVWLGDRWESGESLIGASEGFAKAGDLRRKPENGERWNMEGFDNFLGVPWGPHPGAMGWGGRIQCDYP